MSETKECGKCKGAGCVMCGGTGEIVVASKEDKAALGRRNAGSGKKDKGDKNGKKK